MEAAQPENPAAVTESSEQTARRGLNIKSMKKTLTDVGLRLELYTNNRLKETNSTADCFMQPDERK